jgi:hypothetical protein
VNREHVLQARKYFSDTRIWPNQPAGVRPHRWLDNFLPDEQEHAVALLGAFIFLNKDISEQLLIASVRGVSNQVLSPGDEYSDHREKWLRYRRHAVLTYPTGEEPHPTDSGQMYVRWARQLLSVEEDSIAEPAMALERAVRYGRDLLIIDDFAGSGEQFLETWTRPTLVDGQRMSFAGLRGVGYRGRIHYCPSVCTQYARDRIRRAAPEVRVSAAHVLPPEASLVHPESLYVPDHLAGDMSDVVREVTDRTGLKACPAAPFGFHGLGLGLAFEHSVPDASLPLFWFQAADWAPLRRRR